MLQPLDYAKMCQTGYIDDLKDPNWFDVEDLRAGVMQVNGATVIVFRGSSNVENWLRDFTIIPRRTDRGYWAHGGFIGALRTLWPAIEPYVPKQGSIVVTGHSLGAGIAVLCGEKLNCPVVTFGCPKVYWRFGSTPAMAHSRIACDDDPVTKVPALFFKHLCEPSILFKTEEFLDIKDHMIGDYIKRLEARNDA